MNPQNLVRAVADPALDVQTWRLEGIVVRSWARNGRRDPAYERTAPTTLRTSGAEVERRRVADASALINS